jgi:hypothetical protein
VSRFSPDTFGLELVHKSEQFLIASLTLKKREVNYITIEKELLSILFALETFFPYFYGAHFILYSDYKPLTYLAYASISTLIHVLDAGCRKYKNSNLKYAISQA